MAKPHSRSSSRSGDSSVFTGVLIGLVIGAILAVGVALWISGNNPFKSAPPDPVPASPEPVVPAIPETAPSFDFYKVLPGDTPNDVQPAPAEAPSHPLYYLQAGAFQNPAEADNLKARLALLGIEAVIQTGDLGDKGVFHRVRVGPLRAMDEVNRTRALLVQNHISVTLVKDVPPSQEMP
ncbi:MAG: SPOR domain-containing protein [Thiobacillus sp.]